ncbi:hypothetical protein QTP88_010517 [Uroleucon formosanum]
MMEINIVANEICQRENCQIPTWKQPNYRVDTSLSVHSKKETSNIIYNNLFDELIHSSSTSTQIYTDTSKTEMGIGLAIVHLNETKQFKFNIYNSIYTAEYLALYKGVQLALQIQDTKIDICSDSLSALANLQSIILSEPLAILISNLLSKSSKDIQFVWIPGHCNIKGNEKADEAARNAIMSPNSELIAFSSLVDIKRNINKYCVEWWNSKWHNTSENKLREIKHSVELWPKYTDLNRKNEAGFSNDEFGHIGSFRRQMYIHPEHSNKIPGSILIQYDQTEYRIFFSDDTVTCYLCKQTGHTSNHCKNIIENKAESVHLNNTNDNPVRNDTDHNEQIIQDTVGDSTDTDTSVENITKETNTITHTTQKATTQEKRPAPSTSNSSSHENTPIPTPNNHTPPPTETTNIRKNTGSLATKLKESVKIPQPQHKKPRRSNSIEQIILKLDEALLPAKTAFENIPNLKIDFNQLKHIIENTLTGQDPSGVLTPFNISSMEMIEILETVRPKIKNICIKNRLSSLANLLLELTPLSDFNHLTTTQQ